MTLEQLRIFVAVAQQEHVTRAARTLNLTQSATSSAIAVLEARYATKFFNRVGRRIELTEAGHLFLVEARAILTRSAAAEALLADLAGLARGSLTLAASQTVGNYWLPTIIHRFRSAYPGLTVKLSLGNTTTVATAVHEGVADLGFIEGDIDDPALAVRSVEEDKLVLVVGADHSWARHPPRFPTESCTAQWVCRERGSGTRAALEALLPLIGLNKTVLCSALELPSNEAVCAAVEAGAGVTILSSLVVSRAVKAGSLAVVDLPFPSRRFLILRHKERYSTKAADAFEHACFNTQPACPR